MKQIKMNDSYHTSMGAGETASPVGAGVLDCAEGDGGTPLPCASPVSSSPSPSAVGPSVAVSPPTSAFSPASSGTGSSDLIPSYNGVQCDQSSSHGKDYHL